MPKSYIVITTAAIAGFLSAGVFLWLIFKTPGGGIIHHGDLPGTEEREPYVEIVPAKTEDVTGAGSETDRPGDDEPIGAIFSPETGLNRMAARALRMDPAELEAVDKLLGYVVDRLRKHEMRTARVSEISNERIVFQIAGSDDWAQSVEEDLRKSLIGILGEKRTNTLNLLGKSQLVRDLNHFGARDQEVTFEVGAAVADRKDIEATFRRSCPSGTWEIRASVEPSQHARWLEVTPDEFEHLLFLIPPRR